MQLLFIVRLLCGAERENIFLAKFRESRGRGAKGVMEQLFKRASTHPRSGKGMRALFFLRRSSFFFPFLREVKSFPVFFVEIRSRQRFVKIQKLIDWT